MYKNIKIKSNLVKAYLIDAETGTAKSIFNINDDIIDEEKPFCDARETILQEFVHLINQS